MCYPEVRHQGLLEVIQIEVQEDRLGQLPILDENISVELVFYVVFDHEHNVLNKDCLAHHVEEVGQDESTQLILEERESLFSKLVEADPQDSAVEEPVGNITRNDLRDVHDRGLP